MENGCINKQSKKLNETNNRNEPQDDNKKTQKKQHRDAEVIHKNEKRQSKDVKHP